jgi:ribonuclease-3
MAERDSDAADRRRKELALWTRENEIPVKNLELLNVALTHTSYANEHRKSGCRHNERLEFLGDAVLDLVVGEYLFLRFPTWPEGNLTKAKASVVCLTSCADCASRIHLGDHLLLGKGEEKSGGRTRTSILGDAFEAVIGAVYLDNDFPTVSHFVLGHMKKFLDIVDTGLYDHDYKTDLQEYVQQDGDTDIHYEVISDEGPDHDKTIWTEVYIDGKPMGRGRGKSKKEAEQHAAREALQQFQGK